MYYEIKTERLFLRPFNINDLDTVHAYASDKDNTEFMLWLPNNSKEESLQFLTRAVYKREKENPDSYEFAITLGGEHIGAVSVALNEDRTVGEIGWIINKKYWKKGYAYEAAIAIKDFAVNKLKLLKLIAKCDYRNHGSYKLMEKIGLKLENDKGTRTYPKSGETVQELTYSLIINHT